MIVGPVGSGKSTLMMSILGETEITSGSVTVRGSYGATLQNPWLVTGSVRDNILFGSPYDADRYAKVIKECELEADIALLRGGDQCIVGERGINLSGGQKARLSLARCIYHQSDIVLMDDPLAAVDSHVSDALFETIKDGELLQGRTRLLVTNQTHRLPNAGRIIALNSEGKVLGVGTYTDLVRAGVNFDMIVEQPKPEAIAELTGSGIPPPPTNRRTSSSTGGARQKSSSVGVEISVDSTQIANEKSDEAEKEKEKEKEEDDEANDELPELEDIAEEVAEVVAPATSDNAPKKEVADELYQAEKRNRGNVSGGLYYFFVTRKSGWGFLVVITTQALYLLAPALSVMILGAYSNEVVCVSNEAPGNTSSTCDGKPILGKDSYMAVYVVVQCTGLLLCITSSILIAELRIATARLLHEDLAKAVIEAPISFFDVTPMGRVLNLFSKDTNTIDTTLTQMLSFSMMMFGMVFFEFLAMTIATQGFFLIVLVPATYAYNRVYQYARSSVIEIQRVEAVTRSPIYSSFSEALIGLYTIRAFSASARFQKANAVCLRENIPSYFIAKTALPAFLTVWLNSVGCILALCVAIIVVSSNIASGYAGVSLSYALLVTQQLYLFIFMSNEAEVQLNAVERVRSMATNTPKEKYDDDKELTATISKTEWPEKGAVEVKDLVLGYRNGPDVVHGISFSIDAGERIGVVGRTGSGKSSVFLAFLRIVEARSGSIIIDNIDISRISLSLLRSRIGLIPQDPAIFLGTLRFNLDPFDTHTDEDIWSSLKRVGLDEYVTSLPLKLLAPIHEAGSNLSQGQKQLIAIARSLLRKNNIILMDEATASIDVKADAMLQEMMKVVFAEKTVIAIAHRLDTIMDSDRILVLKKGDIVEYDTPHNLLTKPEFVELKAMVDITGKASSRHLRNIASTSFFKKNGQQESFFTKSVEKGGD